jgi:putative ABC transport system ATP-binding protein
MINVIEIKDLTKNYYVGDIVVPALQNINLDVESGEFVSIMGASGSGKSTLMNIIGCLDEPTEGQYFLDGQDVAKMMKNESADVRNRKIGFVFQNFNLLPRTTALENVELPILYDRSGQSKNSKILASQALAQVGLGDRMDHVPNQLSGGQKQRVALARALVNSPSILLADEPTGNLDSRTSIDIMKLFQELNSRGITIIVVTHEHDIASYTSRTIFLRDGRIIKDRLQQAKRAALLPEEDVDDPAEEVI